MVAWLCLANVVKLYSQNYSYHRYTTDDGLPTNYVYGVAEDNDGYIWAYTEIGIAKFDGYQWHTLDSSDGLPGNDVIRLDRTDRGLIGLSYQKSAFDIVNGKVHPIKNSNGYFLTDDDRYVSTRDGSKLKFDRTANDYIEQPNYDNDTIYIRNNVVATRNNRGIRFQVDKKVLYETRVERKSTYEYTTWKRKGVTYFCILTLNSIVQINTQTHEVIIKNISELGIEPPKFIFGGQLDDQLLIYTNQGVQKLNSKLEVTNSYKTADLKNEYDLLRPYIDSDNNIWLGTRTSGVIMIPSSMQNIINLRKLRSPIEGIVEAWEGRIYAMTDDGHLYQIITNTLEEKLNLNTKSRFKSLNYIEDGDGLLHFGNFSNPKLISSDLTSVNEDPIQNTKKSSTTWNHLYDPRNSCHYYLGRFINVVCDDRQVPIKSMYANIEAYSLSDHKLELSYISAGKIWSIRNKKQIEIDTTPHFFDPLSIHHLDDDTYLIGTGSHGLFHYRDHQYTNILPATQINLIKEVEGLIYLATYNGIYVLDRKFETLQHITTKSGLASNEVYDLLIRNDTMYAATSEQVSIIPYKNLQNPTHSRIVTIDKIIMDGKAYAPDSFDGSHVNNNIEFQYSLLHYPSNRNITYEYRMLPISDQWTQTESRSTVFWRLEPGDYQFQIRAIDTYGNVHVGNQLIDISIPTPWHKNPILWTLAFLGLSYLLYQVFRQREFTNKELAKAEAKQTKRIAELELAGLRSQMNPHFVFNALGAIQYYIQTHKVDEADSYLTSFALLMRRYLESSRNKQISVKDEMNLLSLYTELEEMRFEHQFSVSIDVDSSQTSNLRLPTMLIQPFVENAVLHGLPKRKDGNAQLSISFKTIDDALVVTVADNGIGVKNSSKNKKSLHKSQGLSIIEEKISTIQKMGNMTVDIQTSALSSDQQYPGTLVTITVEHI